MGLDRQPSLPPSLIVSLLGEDAVHHRGEQHPRRIHRSATGLPGDGVYRPTIVHVANVSWVGGPPEGDRQARAEVTPVLIAEHSVFWVIDGIGTVPTVVVLRPAKTVKVGTKHPMPGERLHRIKRQQPPRLTVVPLRQIREQSPSPGVGSRLLPFPLPLVK